MAGEPQQREAVEQSSEAMPVTFNGAQVYIDPATGRLREPTAAERQALNRAIQQDRPSLLSQRPRDEVDARATLRTNRSGTVGALMQLPANQFNYLVAERQADGTVVVRHQEEGADNEAGPAPEVNP